MRSRGVAQGFALVMLLIGASLRLTYPGAIEYKSDEQYMFERVMSVGATEPWPWLGVSSGVYLKNPGMSVWVFLGLGKILNVQTPVDLARAVQLLNIAALGLLLFLSLKLLERPMTEALGRIGLWAGAFAAVNPLAILYQRKIWAQSVLPLFSLCFLWAWSRRKGSGGAFTWGLIGACLGQIHMSGFFFAAAFAAWSAVLELRKREGSDTHWRGWFLGSVLGALPLIPWIGHLMDHMRNANPSSQPMFHGMQEAVQLKFWVFWITDALGLHLGNTLGVHHGNGVMTQLKEFVSSPLVAAAHIGMLLAFLVALVLTLPRLLRSTAERLPRDFTRATWVALIGYGVLLTLSTLLIRRYYLLITFPLEFAGLAVLMGATLNAQGNTSRSQSALHGLRVAFLLCHLVISAAFLKFVHERGGAPMGDFGKTYEAQQAQTPSADRANEQSP